jgi:hypothetical protein
LINQFLDNRHQPIFLFLPMPVTPLQTLDVIEVMENFLQRKRPPEHIRPQLDIAYKIENQSVVIYEVRPDWRTPGKINHFPVAKATWVKAKSLWKVFWQRANGQWYAYNPPTVTHLADFASLVETDSHGCFWG